MTQGGWVRQRPYRPRFSNWASTVSEWGPGGRSERGGRRGVERSVADAGTGGPAPTRRGTTFLLLLHPLELTFRGGRAPPADSWGRRPPRGGPDARPIRPRCPWPSHRPLAARMTRVFERRAGGSGPPGHRLVRPLRHAAARPPQPVPRMDTASRRLRRCPAPRPSRRLKLVLLVIGVGQARMHLGQGDGRLRSGANRREAEETAFRYAL